MGDRYAFLVEWYDQHAALIRKYQLLYYTVDGTCEMIDLKNKRLFLKRSKCPNIQLSDLFIGSVVSVLGRQLTIASYGDEFTKTKLQSKMEKTVGIIKPDCVNKLEQVLKRVHSEGFSICNLRMVTLSYKEVIKFLRDTEAVYDERHVAYMSESPLVVFELMGERAVSNWLRVLGPDDATLARKNGPDSLRARFGKDDVKNGFHGSVSVEIAEREASHFFGSNKMGAHTALFQNSTLGIVKPHAVKDGFLGDIIGDIVSSGLRISALRMFNVEKANAEEFYEVYKGVVREYPQMVEQLSSGPCIAMEIVNDHTHQDQAQHVFRQIVGPSDPELARHLRPNTLRAIHGKDKVSNAIHCTDLPEDNILEVEYFFKILN